MFTFAIWTSFFFGCLVGMVAAVRVVSAQAVRPPVAGPEPFPAWPWQLLGMTQPDSWTCSSPLLPSTAVPVSMLFAPWLCDLSSPGCLQSFSLARDNGFPLSRVWRVVNPRTHVPAYAVCLVTLVGLLFLLPLLGSTAIFNGITSAQSIAWVGAYSVPIFFRLTQHESDFCPGPFYMADYIGVTGG